MTAAAEPEIHWYHGTRAGFGPGGYLMPGDQVGKNNFEDTAGADNTRVYVTPNIEWAKIFALASKGRGKPKVLEVRPYDLVPASTDDEEFACSMAKVLKVVWKA
jgi:hypothetical protein